MHLCTFAEVFASWANFPFEVSKKGKQGPKKDLPLSAVLRYFQAEEFRGELQKFGLIGFDRFGRFAQPVSKPYARRHVYKVPHARCERALLCAVAPLLRLSSAAMNVHPLSYLWHPLLRRSS